MQVLILTTRSSSASVLEKQLGRSPRTIQASGRQTKYSSGIMAGNYSFISPEPSGNLAVCFSCTDLSGSSRALRHSFSVCLHSSSLIAPLSHTISLSILILRLFSYLLVPFPLSLLSSAFFYPLFCFFSSQHILALHRFFPPGVVGIPGVVVVLPTCQDYRGSLGGHRTWGRQCWRRLLACKEQPRQQRHAPIVLTDTGALREGGKGGHKVVNVMERHAQGTQAGGVR